MIKNIEDLNIENKKVIIRCDFNVPIENGKIIDDTRIKAALKTINYCLDKNCAVILMSHLGRIKTKEDKKEKTLEPVAERLSSLLNKDVIFIDETHGKKLEKACENLKSGEVLLMENTRFEDLDGKKESNCDEELSKYWASLGDIFIDDAFGCSHRRSASNVGISEHLETGLGFLMQKEIDTLSELNSPKRPFSVILGGKKVEDKIGVIKSLAEKADYILIGGGMAFTFLKAEGFDIGSSVVDNEKLSFCKEIIDKYEDKIILPVDMITVKEFKNTGNYETKDITEFALDDIGVDIGPRTVKNFEKILRKSKTVFWNGPLGVYEFTFFRKATEDILKFIVENNIKTVLGGGDIVGCASLLGLKDKVYFASTGGGASLEYLEGKPLPALEIKK